MKNRIFNWKLLLATLLLLSVSFTSCDDDDDDTITGVVPTSTNVMPSEGLRPGDLITITGSNLDYVKEVRFGAICLVAKDDFESFNSNQIVVAVPAKAPSGELYLIAMDDVVPNVLVTELSMKLPAISAVNPTEINPGDTIRIKGTDLDLVSEVNIGTWVPDTTIINSNQIKVLFPLEMTTGGVLKLTTLSGEIVTYTTPIKVTIPPEVPMIEDIAPMTTRTRKKITITGENLNEIEKITFGNIEAVNYGNRTSESIEVYVPATVAAGEVVVTLTSFAGDNFTKTIMVVTGTDPIADTSLVLFDFEDMDNPDLPNYLWDNIGAYSSEDGIPGSGRYYEITAGTWSASKYWLFADNSEGGYPSVSGKENYYVKMDILLKKDIAVQNSEFRLLLAGQQINILPYLLNETEDTWTTYGEWTTIAIPLSAWNIADPTPAEATSSIEWGMTFWANGVDYSGVSIDNIRYERK